MIIASLELAKLSLALLPIVFERLLLFSIDGEAAGRY